MAMNAEMQTTDKCDRVKIHSEAVDTFNPVEIVCLCIHCVSNVCFHLWYVSYVCRRTLPATLNACPPTYTADSQRKR